MKNFTPLYTPEDIKFLLTTETKIFGGKTYSPVTKHNQKSAENLKGEIGEQITAGTLNLLTYTNPNIYVCHNVHLHDTTQNGETDHILISGQKIVLIETKTTNINNLHITNKGYPVLDNRNKYNDNNLNKKINKYHTRFPEYDITGLLVFTGKTGHLSTENPTYTPLNIVNLTQHIETYLNTKTATKTSQKTVTYFAENCRKN